MQKLPSQDQAASTQSSAANCRSLGTGHALLPLSAGLGARIESLEQRAKAAVSLLARVQSALPEPEKNHLLSASYHDDTLVLTMDSAAWGTHLRYQENTLRERLVRAGENSFTHLKIRIGRP